MISARDLQIEPFLETSYDLEGIGLKNYYLVLEKDSKYIENPLDNLYYILYNAPTKVLKEINGKKELVLTEEQEKRIKDILDGVK